MSGEVERMARLLCEAEGVPPDNLQAVGPWEAPFSKSAPNWHFRRSLATRLHAAGLTILPLEPTDEQIEEMVADMWPEFWTSFSEPPIDMDDEARQAWHAIARAAYRAAVKGGR